MARNLLSSVWTGWAERELLDWEKTLASHGVEVEEEGGIRYRGRSVLMRKLDNATYLSDGAVELLGELLSSQEQITIMDIIATVE